MSNITEASIVATAEKILLEGKHFEDNGCKLADLMKKIKSNLEGGDDLKDSKIYGVLLQEVKSEEGKIRSGGPHRGYYIKSHEGRGNEKPSKIKERHLYPLVEMWMREKKFYKTIENVSNNTKGKKWGNPDVVGVSYHNNFGINYFELSTAEVKTSMEDWRMYIFEAVSHKRFSDKVYYMFGSADDKPISEIEDMFYYAEKYKIGLCKIIITEDIMKWNSLDEGKKLEIMDNSIVELFPAPIDSSLIREKMKFLDNLGVKTQIGIF